MTEISEDDKGPRFTRKGAADYVRDHHGVRCAASTLAKLATVGGGPVLEYVGHLPTYRQADLDAWIRNRTRRVASTSELGQPARAA